MESGQDVTENKIVKVGEKHLFCRYSNRLVCPPQRSLFRGPSKGPLPGKTIEVRKCRLDAVRCVSVMAVGVFQLTL